MFSCRTSVSLSVRPLVVRFSFPDDNLSKFQWIFTKLGMCIDIIEIWIGIANGQISLFFTELSARDTIMAGIIVKRFYFFTEYQFYLNY